MEEDLDIISTLGNTILTKDYVNISYFQIGNKYSMTIFLKDISSIIYGFQSKPSFILLGIISIIFGIYLNNHYVDNALTWGNTIGIILFILYFVTKKQTVVITAHSSQKITQIINDKNKAKSFVDDIIKAKAKAIA